MARKKEPEYVREFLESYTVADLKSLVALVATEWPTRKAALVQEIMGHLLNITKLQALWNSLNDLQQHAVSETLNTPNFIFNGMSFKAKYGAEPAWGTLQRSSYQPSNPTLLRLFIFGDKIPLDLVQPLKTFVPIPKVARIKTLPEIGDTMTLTWTEYDWQTRKRVKQSKFVEVTQAHTERIALHDIQAVLQLVELGKVKVSAKTKRPSGATVRAVGTLLQGGDFYPPEESANKWTMVPGAMKAFAWPLIIQSAGFAEIAGSKLQLTPSGKKALKNAPEKAIRAGWKKWLKTTILDEFNRIERIKGQTGKGKRTMTAPSKRRAMIAKALTAVPANQWITFDEFSRFMQAANYTFEINRDLWNLYIESPGYGALGHHRFGEWHVLQARYLMVFLLEYASTLGLLDVAYIHPNGARPDYRDLWGIDDYDALSRYDGLMAIRVNNLGAWCLGHTQTYTPSPFAKKIAIKILPNMDIVATETLPAGDKLFINRFAEQTADRVWHIEQARLLKLVEEGQTIAEVVKFLEARSGITLPDTVAIFFKEMVERVSQLADRGMARVIEVKDPALAQLIINDSKVGKSCLLAGDRHLIIPADLETAFQRSLHELGYAVAK